MNRGERALDGEGQVAMIIGETGIGKSRLVQRFHEQIAGRSHTEWSQSTRRSRYFETSTHPARTNHSLSEQVLSFTIQLRGRGNPACGTRAIGGDSDSALVLPLASGVYSLNSSSSALASFKSGVSKPSVNQA